MTMQIRLDRDVNALYIALRPGEVSKTVELTDSVYVDVDEQDDPIGIEFVTRTSSCRSRASTPTMRRSRHAFASFSA